MTLPHIFNDDHYPRVNLWAEMKMLAHAKHGHLCELQIIMRNLAREPICLE